MKNFELKLSKFMSYALRHRPDEFSLQLDEHGFCDVTEFLSVVQNQKGLSLVQLHDIQQVVKNCSKQRYALEGNKIKANYGHSSIKPNYQESKPPAILYNGTNVKVVDLILQEGIKKMGRSFAHFSEGLEFATLAGQRRGELVILKVDAESAHRDGIKFYYAGNEVWLAEYMPSQYLEKI